MQGLPVPLSSNGMPLEPARLLYGRGGIAPGFEDLNIDIYPPLVFVTLYGCFSDGELREMYECLKRITAGKPVIIQDRSVRPAVTRIADEYPDEIIVTEAGLQYYLNPGRGQNPGFFIDMRDGRALIRELVGDFSNAGAEVRVLNLFAYTSALSVAALAAGAAFVVNIDKNRRSLDIGRKNHRLNHGNFPGGYRNQALFLPHDIFKSFGKLKKEGPYTLIIADPPPSQKGSFIMMKDYPRLLKRLPEMLEPGGRLLLTQNGPGWSWEDFEALIRENLPDFRELQRVQPPADFAPSEDGRGLKIIIASRK